MGARIIPMSAWVPQSAQAFSNIPSGTSDGATAQPTFPEGGVDSLSLSFESRQAAAAMMSLSLAQSAALLEPETPGTAALAGATVPVESPSGSAQAGAQLSFAFEQEIRTSQLVRFQQQVADTASNVTRSQASLFTSVSQRVSMRFSASGSLSGSVLAGFNKAVERLNSLDPEMLRDFLLLVQDFLGLSDGETNGFLELIEEFFGDSFDLFKETLEQFLGEMQSLFDATTAQGRGRGATASATREFFFELEVTVSARVGVSVSEQVHSSDPVVVDLDGDGIELTSYQEGVHFDIAGTGQAVRTAFVTGGDAFLAFDRNGNGVIDDGRELFGDQNGAANGFEELRSYDSNGDGRIDSADPVYEQLLLFRDDNLDGVSQRSELFSLSSAGIVSMNLDYAQTDLAAAGGNRIAQIGAFTWADGSSGRMADALLNYVA